SPLPFLSKNRREKLGLSDMDASKTFIALHQLNSHLPSAFFCSEHTFSGYAIPHNALAAPLKPRQRYGSDPLYKEKFAPDLYSAETAFYACLQLPAQAGEPFRPAKIHKSQKLGFENWFLRRKNAAPATGIPALQKIRSRYFGKGEYSGMPAVSASSMAPYFKCPYIWIFKNVLELENVEIETTLMASNIAGDVFHAVLNLFLNEIKQSGMPIAGPLHGGDSSSSRAMLTKSYSVLLGKCVKTVFDSFPSLPGSTYQVMSMLTARLLCSEEELFYANLEKFLVKFISFFAGFKVIATEAMYQLKQKTHSLKGKVDCVLEDTRDSSTEKGSLVIVDFKTKYMPGLNDYFGEEGLKDFQIPMYITLAEAEYKKEVHSSLFFSIVDTEPMVLFGSVKDEKSGVSYPKKADNFILHGSDEYKRIMGEFSDKAAIFADEISNGKFPPYPEYSVSCPECAHNKICRTLYRIYQGNFSEISKG
ncbi:MAG: PD-(D/E)XK nuclease family protein, partial [Treponema sp.]|nr:PD-(D/E)XK nuclease family protein [Treponema sp.]